MSGSAGTIIPLGLEPLDVLFFRDGRPFGAATRANTDLPQPQTLAGALWTGMLQETGCRFAEFGRRVGQGRPLPEAIEAAGGDPRVARIRVRGPWLAQRCPGGADAFEVLVPAPAVLHAPKGAAEGGTLKRLRPVGNKSLPGWRPPEPGMRPLWLCSPEATEPANGYLNRAGLEAFLSERAVESDKHLVRRDALFAQDHRTGIAVHPDRLTAAESQIYMASFLAFKPDVFLYAEVQLPDEGFDALGALTTLQFGGEGRRVAVRRLEERFSWPDAAPGDRQKPLLLLTTAGLFGGRDHLGPWKPAALGGQILSAALPGAVSISGWDLARRGPKPSRFGVAAGSVYFLEFLPADLPPSLCDRDEDRQQGWGCFVKGAWTDD